MLYYCNASKFFKKIRVPAFFGFNELWSFDIIRPAVENTLSAGLEVAGMHIYTLAT